jgi:hypothetical protein
MRAQQGKPKKQATPPLSLQRQQQQTQTQTQISKLKEKIKAMQELCNLMKKDTKKLMSQPYKDKDKDQDKHPMLTPNWFSPQPMLTPWFSPPPVSSKTQLTPPQITQTQQQKRKAS